MRVSGGKRTKAEAASRAPAPQADPGDRRALDALEQVSQMIAGDLDLEAVVASAMGACAWAMNAEACSILLKDREQRELRFHLVDGPQTDGLAAATLPIDDHSIAGWVAAHREPLLIPDAYEDARFNPAYDAKTGFRTRSVICAPLVAKGALLGVIQVLNRRDGRSFDAEDLRLAQGIASLVAVAMHNAEEHRARLQAERLATIGQTIASTAHCIKNTLNGLEAGSYLIEQNLRADAGSPVARGWGMVRRHMQFLSNVVLDMLSYSKARTPLCQPCEIAALCQDVVGLLGQQAAGKGVTLIASAELGEARVDETGLKRCLINLVGNAIDACPESGGLVEVSAGPVERRGYFAIRVRDNGCGMSEETARRVFDPFFSTKGGKGTGLGLPVTRKIVEEHGGTVRVTSRPGEGTEFALELPLAPPDEAPGGRPDRHPRPRAVADNRKERGER